MLALKHLDTDGAMVMMVVEWMNWWMIVALVLVFLQGCLWCSISIHWSSDHCQSSHFVILLLWFMVKKYKRCHTVIDFVFQAYTLCHAFKSLDPSLIGMWLVKKLIIIANWSVNDFSCVWVHLFKLSHSCFLAVMGSTFSLLQSWTQNLFPVQLAVRKVLAYGCLYNHLSDSHINKTSEYFLIYSVLIFVFLLRVEFLVVDLFSIASAPLWKFLLKIHVEVKCCFGLAVFC